MESANQCIGDIRFEFFDFSYIKEGKVTGGKGQKSRPENCGKQVVILF